MPRGFGTAAVRQEPGHRQTRVEAQPSSEWITTEVAHLRIIPDELWSAAKERQAQTRRAIASSGKLAAANRPRYLFSGLGGEKLQIDLRGNLAAMLGAHRIE